MIFGESIKDNIEFVIVAVTAVIIAFFYVLYKKRKTIANLETSKKIMENSIIIEDNLWNWLETSDVQDNWTS